MIVNQFKFGDCEINQTFYHDTLILGEKYMETNLNFEALYDYSLEYIIIVIPSELLLNGTTRTIINSCSYHLRHNYNINYNKVYPLECIGIYDEETNILLRKMVEGNDMTNILFVPFRCSTNDSAININPNESSYIITEKYIDNSQIDIYIKLVPKNDISNIQNQLIDQLFDNLMPPKISIDKYEYKISNCLGRNGSFFNNFYISLIKNRNIKFNKNYHEIVKDVEIEIGDKIVSKIPISYVKLYLKVIKGIDLKNFSFDEKYVIPINLKGLVNINSIPFINLKVDQVRINCYLRGNIDNFNHNLQKKIRVKDDYPDYISFINYLPKELWNFVIKYVDSDKDFVNIRQVCKFFYSIISCQQIMRKYKQYKMHKEDLMLKFVSIDVMFNDVHFKRELSLSFINQFRSINNFELNIDNNHKCNFVLSKYTSPENVTKDLPIEWVIIQLDKYQDKNIIQNITFNPLEPYDFDERVNGILSNCKCDDIYRIEKDPEFEKMNDPENNRYLFYLDPNMIYESIEIKFKERINCRVSIYIATNNWFASEVDIGMGECSGHMQLFF
jgi:hypothetical protein